jgi:dihydrofolate reductase
VARADEFPAPSQSWYPLAMSLLRVHNFVVSLDGFASGEGQSLETGFGHAQDELLGWFERIRLWRGSQQDDNLGPDEAIASAWGAGIGAEIMGRNKFRPTHGPWPEDGWIGWWGEDPPFHTPCFVWTHYPREPIVTGDTTFHFVDGTAAEVLALAKEAAGDLDVRLGGGPTTVNAFLADDLVDYLHVVVVPIVLGKGVPLWTGLGGLHTRFHVETVAVPSGATHLFFTRQAPAPG